MRANVRQFIASLFVASFLFFAVAVVAGFGTVTLLWDNPPDNPPGTVTEIWSTTNLAVLTNHAEWEGTNLWTMRTNAVTNRATMPAGATVELFKARNRAPDGQLSDWSRKPTL